jgi:hypothetical protein
MTIQTWGWNPNGPRMKTGLLPESPIPTAPTRNKFTNRSVLTSTKNSYMGVPICFYHHF